MNVVAAAPQIDALIRKALDLGVEHDQSEDAVIDMIAEALQGGPVDGIRWMELKRNHDRLEYMLLEVYARLKLAAPAALAKIRDGEEP